MTMTLNLELGEDYNLAVCPRCGGRDLFVDREVIGVVTKYRITCAREHGDEYEERFFRHHEPFYYSKAEAVRAWNSLVSSLGRLVNEGL